MYKRLGWIIVLLIFLNYMINYIDRIALSITVPLIEQDLALNAEQFGFIFGGFFFGYAIFNFLGGLAVDKFGPTLVLGIAIGVWSLFCGLTAFVTGFYSLLIIRILFGMAEGPICSCSNKIIHAWFPKKQAATALGILGAGSPLGGAVSGPIVGFLALSFGWRLAFVIIASMGIIWMIIWFIFITDNPNKNRWVGKKEVDYINQAKVEEERENNTILKDEQKQVSYTLGYYLKQPIILATAFSFFCYNYILFFFLSWFPAYLVNAHGLNIKEMSVMTVIPWIVGFIGLAIGGYISDLILRITGRVLYSRKLVLVTCLFFSAVCVGLAGTVSSVVPAVVLMSFSIFSLYITGALYWAIVQDVVHKSRIGGTTGFVHFIGSISGIVGPIITGFIVQNTGKFDSAFILAGTIAALGAIVVGFVIKTPKNTTTA